jgi:hypothetical protein
LVVLRTCRRRLQQRETERGVSDGRLEIFDDFCSRFEPIADLADTEHLVLDTAQTLESSLETLRAHLATWPRGLTG